MDTFLPSYTTVSATLHPIHHTYDNDNDDVGSVFVIIIIIIMIIIMYELYFIHHHHVIIIIIIMLSLFYILHFKLIKTLPYYVVSYADTF